MVRNKISELRCKRGLTHILECRSMNKTDVTRCKIGTCGMLARKNRDLAGAMRGRRAMSPCSIYILYFNCSCYTICSLFLFKSTKRSSIKSLSTRCRLSTPGLDGQMSYIFDRPPTAKEALCLASSPTALLIKPSCQLLAICNPADVQILLSCCPLPASLLGVHASWTNQSSSFSPSVSGNSIRLLST